MNARYAGDLRWLLERLKRREPVRINCGGGEYRGVGGELWSHDRFFIRGSAGWTEMYSDKIEGTEDDLLYAEWRYFAPSGIGTNDAYRVPLPRGRYRVTLYFAEAYSVVKSRPDTRGGDVVLEGRTVLKDHVVAKHVGFSRVDSHNFETKVEDGMLEISIIDGPEPFFPFLSAFEIERLE